MERTSFEQMLQAGVHFGHLKRKFRRNACAAVRVFIHQLQKARHETLKVTWFATRGLADGDALRVGDEVDCCVKGADAAKRVLSLSLLQVEAPEDAAGRAPVKAFAVDQLLENVEVARVTEHAAFVDVGAAVPAYLHVADIGLLPRTKVGAARVPRLRLEKAGQVIDKCWVKSVDIARDRLRLSLVPPEERDDWTLYGARSKRDEPRVVDDRDDFEN